MVLSNKTRASIDEFSCRLVRGLREQIKFNALRVRDSLFDVGIASTLQNGTQQGVALIGVRRHRNIAIRYLGRVGRWQEEIFAAVSLVHTTRSYILDSGLPVIHDATVDQAIICWRDLQDHGTDILSIE